MAYWTPQGSREGVAGSTHCPLRLLPSGRALFCQVLPSGADRKKMGHEHDVQERLQKGRTMWDLKSSLSWIWWYMPGIPEGRCSCKTSSLGCIGSPRCAGKPYQEPVSKARLNKTHKVGRNASGACEAQGPDPNTIQNRVST